MNDAALEMLSDLLSRPEGRWSLAEAALAIARLERPDLDPARIESRLDSLARRAREEVGHAWHPRFVAAGIARVLYDQEGFGPVRQGRESASALFLDEVLESRCGAPTLLAVVYIDVARRIGHRFEAIAIPGMALLRSDHAAVPYLFDPAHGAQPLRIEDVRRTLAGATKGRAEFREGWLRPVTQEQVIARIVSALKALYWRAGDYDRALRSIQLLLAIRPDDPREIRDSGRLLFLLGRYRDAIEAFESYLSHNPHGEDADAVRMLLLEARAGLSSR